MLPTPLPPVLAIRGWRYGLVVRYDVVAKAGVQLPVDQKAAIGIQSVGCDGLVIEADKAIAAQVVSILPGVPVLASIPSALATMGKSEG